MKSKKKVVDTRSFIEKARLVHGDLYEYSKAQYINQSHKVEIICRRHGSFWCLPANHCNKGAGCRKCESERRKKTQVSLSKTLKFRLLGFFINAGKYDYSKSYAVSSQPIYKIDVICPQHGLFRTNYQNHIKDKSGCPACGHENKGLKLRNTTEDFVKRAREAHGDVYDYSETVYETAVRKVKINCKSHGLFERKAAAHLAGRGCPVCAKENKKWNPMSAYGLKGFYGTSKKSNLYVATINNEFIKIGLSKNPEVRFSDIRRESGYQIEIVLLVEGPANKLFNLEQYIIHKSGVRRHSPEIRFRGDTECINIKDASEVIEIIQSRIYSGNFSMVVDNSTRCGLLL